MILYKNKNKNKNKNYLLPYQGDADRVSIQTDWQWPRNQTTSFSLPPRDHWCKLPPPLIILKQGCCFTQMLPLTVTPCIPSEIYPCSTRSAMGVDGVMKVLKTPRPVIIVAEQIIHWKRITPFPPIAIGVLNSTLVYFNYFRGVAISDVHNLSAHKLFFFWAPRYD